MYQIGEWLRVRFQSGSEVIGEVTGFGKARNHLTGEVEEETVIIKNATGGAEARLSEVVEKIDPVEEWNRIRPGELLPEYLRQLVISKGDSDEWSRGDRSGAEAADRRGGVHGGA